MPGQMQLDRERKWTKRRTPWPDMQGFLTSQVVVRKQRWMATELDCALRCLVLQHPLQGAPYSSVGDNMLCCADAGV